jgi:hypothetical protein
MTGNTAPVRRNALILFNFMGMKQRNDKRIGDLTVGDFIEMCEILGGDNSNENQKEKTEE